MSCGGVTEATYITVQWDDSEDSTSVKYNYKVNYLGNDIYSTIKSSSQHSGSIPTLGTYSISVQAVDSVGNLSDWTEPCTFTRVANDNDGVDYKNDLCLETPTSDEPSLTETLGVNRHIWSNTYDSSFETLVPGQKGAKVRAESQFSISETRGCSCIQILDLLKANGLGEFGGHYKFGCSKSIMQDFILDINDGIIDGRYYINSYNVSARYGDIGTTTEFYTSEGITYDLEVSGTFRFANWGTDFGIADAEYMSRYGAYNIPGFVNGWAQNPDPDNLPCGADLRINNTCQDWGDYNPEHNYSLSIPGDGNPILFTIYDDYYSDNSGFLTVKVYANL